MSWWELVRVGSRPGGKGGWLGAEARCSSLVLGMDCSGSPALLAFLNAAKMIGPSTSGSCSDVLESSAKAHEAGAGFPVGSMKEEIRPEELRDWRKVVSGAKRIAHFIQLSAPP